MARPLDAAPLPRRDPGPARARDAASCSARPRSSPAPSNPIALVGNGAIRARAGRALRDFVQRDRASPVGRDVHGQGAARLRGSPRARDGRAAVARLRDGRVRGRRRRRRDRLRPGRARARALEPARRQADHRDRQRRRRDRRVLHARGGADRRHRPRAARGWPAAAQRVHRASGLDGGCATSCCGALARRPRATTTSRCARRGCCGTSAQALGPRGHPGLRRRSAQAVDRADVPRPRARHGADRQRPGRDGVRACRRRSRPSSCIPSATWSRSAATAAS